MARLVAGPRIGLLCVFLVCCDRGAKVTSADRGGSILFPEAGAGLPGSDGGDGASTADAAPALEAGTDAVVAADADGERAEAEASGPEPLMKPCSAIPPAPDPIPPEYPSDAKRLPGLSADMNVFEVPPPEPLSWKACGTGCKELETPWANGIEVPGALVVTTAGGVVEDRPWLLLKQRLPGWRRRTWVGSADGPAVRAYVEAEVTGSQDTGFSTFRTVAQRGYLFTVYDHDWVMWVFGAELSRSPVCLATRKMPAYSIQTAAFTSSRWAAAGNPAPIVTGAWPLVPGKEDLQTLWAPTGGEQEDLASAGDWLFWVASTQTKRLWAWRPDGSPRRLVDPTPGIKEDLCCVAADDHHIAWKRGRDFTLDGGPSWLQVDLMVATLPIASLPVTGKLVRRIPTTGMYFSGLVAGGHWADFGAENNKGIISIVRFSDGRIWKIPIERAPGVELIKILYLTSTEIGLLEKKKQSYTPVAHTVVRYDLASLGPGEPAP